MMTGLDVTVEAVADDIANNRHTVVIDWLTDAWMTEDVMTGRPIGLALPVRCMDCVWNHTAHLTLVTQEHVDIAVADLAELHNNTREGDHR